MSRLEYFLSWLILIQLLFILLGVINIYTGNLGFGLSLIIPCIILIIINIWIIKHK